MASRTHSVTIGIKADTSGLDTLSSTLNQIESKIDSISGKSLNVKAEIEFDGKSIDKLESIFEEYADKKVELAVNVDDKASEQLKDIQSQLESMSSVELAINVGGNVMDELEGIHGAIEGLAQGLSEGLTDYFKNVQMDSFSQMIKGIHSVESELGGLERAIKSIDLDVGDIGVDKISDALQDAMSQAGQFQNQLNDIQMPNYFAQYDGAGNLNLGALGGQSILSMIGLQSAKQLMWENAAQDETNTQLLRKMPVSKTGVSLAAKTYEGGTNDIFHAVTQSRLVRRTNLIPQAYAFTTATDASFEDLTTNLFGGRDDTEWGSGTGLDVIAAFGEHVQLISGSEQRATSAMFDLAKGFTGAYSSIDQYGVSAATLAREGFKAKDPNNTVADYLTAVGKVIKSNEVNDLIDKTTEGGLTKLRKKFNNAGNKLGKFLLTPVADVANLANRLDTATNGLFAQSIIAVTGLASAMGPLKETFRGLQQTFGALPSNIRSTVDGVSQFFEKIGDIGNRDLVGKLDPKAIDKLLELSSIDLNKTSLDRIGDTMAVRGIHDYDNYEAVIDNAKMSKRNKKILKRQAKWDEKIFGHEAKETEKKHKEIYNHLWNGEDKEFEDSIKDMSFTQQMKARKGEIKKRQDAYDTGRKNEISQLSTWDKFKKDISGVKNEMDLLGSYRKGRDEKQEQLEGRQKGKKKKPNFLQRWGTSLSASKSGLSRAGGALASGIGGIGSAFGSLLSMVNPITIAIYALTAAIAAMGAVLLIANSYSAEFRDKLQHTIGRLHDLAEKFAYFLGDMFQAMGLTGKGGIDGVVDVATSILNGVETIVGILENMMTAITGKDYKQQSKMQPHVKAFEDTLEQIKAQEKERGGVQTADKDLYDKLMNEAQNISMWDPNYFNHQRLKDYGLDSGAYDPLVERFRNNDAWSYYRDEWLPEYNKAMGTDIKFEGDDFIGEEGIEWLRKQRSEKAMWDMSGGWLGKSAARINAESEHRDVADLNNSIMSTGGALMGGGIGAGLGFLVGGPVGAIIGGALGAIIGKTLANAIQNCLADLGLYEPLLAAAEHTKPVFDALGKVVGSLGPSLVHAGQILWKVGEAVVHAFQIAWKYGSMLWDFLSKLFTGDFAGALKGVQDFISGIDWGAVVDGITKALSEVDWGAVLSGLGRGLFDLITSGAGGPLLNGLLWIAGSIKGIFDSIFGGGEGGGEGIASKITPITDFITSILPSLQWAGEQISNLFNNIHLEGIISALSPIVPIFWAIAGAAQSAFGFIQDHSGAFDDISNGANTFMDILSRISDFITGTIIPALEQLQGMGSWLSSLLPSFPTTGGEGEGGGLGLPSLPQGNPLMSLFSMMPGATLIGGGLVAGAGMLGNLFGGGGQGGATGGGLPDISGIIGQLQSVGAQIQTIFQGITASLTTSITTLGTTLTTMLQQATMAAQQFLMTLTTGLLQIAAILPTIVANVLLLGVGFMTAAIGAMLFGTMALTGFMMATASLMMLNAMLLVTSATVTMMAGAVSMMAGMFMMMSNYAMMLSTYLMMSSMSMMQMIASATMLTAVFMMLGAVVTTSLAVATAAIMMFSAQAIMLMYTTGSGMVNAFRGSFHGIAAAVNTEMAAAYATMAAWGAKLIALSAAIGAAMSSAFNGRGGNEGGSPGNLYRVIRDELGWSLELMKAQPRLFSQAAAESGASLSTGFASGYSSTNPNSLMGSAITAPTFNSAYGTAGANSLSSNYIVPTVSNGQTPMAPKNIANTTQGNGGTTINNNLHMAGYGDYEELAKVVVQVINEKFLFDVERANRTV